MPGRPKRSHHRQKASGRQLWRLNQLGRLRIVDEAIAINSAEADSVIRAELEKLGEPYFPDTKVATRLAAERESDDEAAAPQP
jgi:hypothetical protein